MNKQAFVYILSNRENGTLYTGVTSDLVKRVYEHKIKVHSQSFTAKYEIDKLVWYIAGDNIEGAIALEKKIKNRNRSWKINLIEKQNPDWNDLSVNFMDSAITLRSTQNDGNLMRSRRVYVDEGKENRHPARSRRVYGNMDSAITLRSTQNDELSCVVQNDENIESLHPARKSNRHPAQSRRVYHNNSIDSATPLRFVQNDEIIGKEK